MSRWLSIAWLSFLIGGAFFAKRFPAPWALDHTLRPSFDAFGRPVWRLFLEGAPLSLGLSLVSIALAALAALIFSVCLIAAGPRMRLLLERIMITINAFPFFVLGMALGAVYGQSLLGVLVALMAAGFPGLALIMGETAVMARSQGFVVASRNLGANGLQIFRRHILPSLLGVVRAKFPAAVAAAIMTESALSFLGLGLSPDVLSWGTLLAQGQEYLLEAPWILGIGTVGIMISISAVFRLSAEPIAPTQESVYTVQH